MTSTPAGLSVDLNRSGVALMEIVSKPDLRSSEEAKAYVTKLRTILRYLGTCDGDMEKGSLRADVNVSVRKPGDPFGTRCEIKNDQFPSPSSARRWRAKRAGRSASSRMAAPSCRRRACSTQQGRDAFHALQGRSARLSLIPPDPDLLPLEFDQAFVDGLAAHLPELPDEKKKARLHRRLWT